MLTLTSFLDLLPNIKPRIARRLILENNVIPEAARKDIHDRTDWALETVLVVGPDAAAAILAAYREAKLPLKRASFAPSDAPEARAYLARSDELRLEIAERDRQRRLPKDLSLFREEDLSNLWLIDKIFVEQIGLKEGNLTLGGIEIHKSLLHYSSNSGKPGGWRVRFSWTGSDGQRRMLEKVPPEADNRRNDPKRNWGLHE